MNHKITKVLIANRGEIALRIKRACGALGIKSTQIVSEADTQQYFAKEAAEIECIGPAAAKDSYLNIEKIINAAKKHGCNAIHPGYGFLSENGDFAEATKKAGLIFIGPTAENIRSLGSKTEARKLVTANGVPVTPGSAASEKDEDLLAAAKKVGFPVILKAVAGGGGRGMRLAHNVEELKEAIPRARAEALKNFGSQAVYLEKFIEKPRHVEVQIFGDTHGNVLHFGTRDCSAQRRHQKLVEEAPAPNLSDKLREKIHKAAVSAAKSVGYVNAGTAEFLVSGEEIYFLEMNTRIQVEHPITEVITGVDLVQLQIKIAEGEKLPFTQDQIRFSGHAIEFRINVEDPENDFRPATGKIAKWRRPQAPWIREDIGFCEGDQVTPYYDGMISKLIVQGSSREEAIYRSFLALKEYEVKGFATTVQFHQWLLSTKEFQAGGFDIGFVEREFSKASLAASRSLLLDSEEHHAVDELTTFSESFTINSLNGKEVTVEVRHEDGGTFLAIPFKKPGEPHPQKLWRRSNSRQSVLEAVRELV